MRRPTRFMVFTRSIAAVIVASGFTVSFGDSAAATPTATTSPVDSVSISSNEPEDSVASYWTEERKNSATPEPIREHRSSDNRRPSTPSRLSPQSAPGRPPAAESLATGVAPRPSGASAELWSQHGVMPARTIGTLYYVRDDGTNGYCTATVLTAENRSTIWTAGHCVHGGDGRGWFDRFLFEPDHHDGQAPYGQWEWKTVATTQGWIDGDYAYDIGAVALYPNNLGSVADVTGSQGYKFGQGRSWYVYFFGYPQDGVPDRPEFTGERLFYCTGQTDQKSVFDDRMVTDCDMHHGASGGPWIYDLQSSRGWGYIVGAYSSRDDCLCDSEVRSAYHGDAAINVFDAVRNA